MSSNITLRLEKGTDLSFQEGDNNFTDTRKIYRFTEDSVTTGGAGNAYSITSTNTTQTSFVANMMFGFIASFTNNATSPTVAIDGLDPKVIKRGNGQTVYSGEIVLNSFYIVRYNNADDSFWLLENPTTIEAVGTIKLWSGSVASIPAGYGLCDGSSGTPDLTDRFIVGAGGALNPGNTGGSQSKNTSSAGSHNHSGSTGGHALTIAEMPNHDHNIGGVQLYREPKNEFSSFGPDYDPADNDGNTVTAQSEGGGSAHDHSISSDGSHTHSISDIRPPFYALAYIMKL